MNEFLKINDKLVSEGNRILDEFGLRNILEKYGTLVPTGSYMLSTMTWRDLDLEIVNDIMTPSRFFDLGKEITEQLRPRRMSYRNEVIGKTLDLPSGYYWGIYVDLNFEEEWKIDVWAIDNKEATRTSQIREELVNNLTVEKRLIVLEIKTHFCKSAEYRRKISSMDIYRSVIDDNVNSIESFRDWIYKNKQLVIR